jgi:rod shape-determining protein MreC
VVKQYLTTALLTLISLVLFFGDAGQRTTKARFLSHTAFYPLLAPLHTAEALLEAHALNRSLMRERAELLLKVAALENRLTSQTQVRPAIGDSTLAFVIGEVIGFSGSLREHGLIIDRGSRDGVEVDFPVVGGQGVVGKVVSVMPRQCVALPIDHPRFRLGVLDKTTRVQGIIESDDNGRVAVTFFRSNANVAPGDTILTSNLSRVFPKGLPVGRISGLIRSTEGGFVQATLKPFAEPADMEHVFILKYHKSLEEALMPENTDTETDETVPGEGEY